MKWAFVGMLILSNGEFVQQEFTYDTELDCKYHQVLFMMTAENRDMSDQVVPCHEG